MRLLKTHKIFSKIRIKILICFVSTFSFLDAMIQLLDKCKSLFLFA